jgi:ABC-type transporter Mla subunit MlaD
MPSEATFWLMAGALVCSTIALVANALASYAMMKAILGLKQKVEPLIPQAQRTLLEAASTLREATGQLKDVGERTSRFFDAANQQLVEIDKTREELSTRVLVQVERAELVLDDTLKRVHEVVGTVHNGVIRPVREVNGVLNGLRAAISTFVQGRRPAVDRIAQDEEMFI